MTTSRAGFLIAGTSLLTACAGAHAHSLPALRSSQMVNQVTTGGGGGGTPTCSYVGQAGCIDPESGLYVIGSVTVHVSSPTSDPQMSMDWTPDGAATVIGPIYRVGQAFTQCTGNNAVQLTAYAFAMARYLQSNWSTFTSASDSLKTYVGVYLAGGATAIELIGAVAAELSVADWVALLLATGLTAAELWTQIHCYAVAFGAS